MRPQPGIFALADPEHSFVELDLLEGADPADLVKALAALSGPETTITGVNFVIGVRPEVWAMVAPAVSEEDGTLPAGPGPVRSFEEIAGPELVMPATQHDAWFWLSGGSRDLVFDSTLRVLDSVAAWAAPASELAGWLYDHTRDLTGFIDGTENPSMLEAPAVAAGPDGSSVLLFQKWAHLSSWRRLTVEEQERVIGRTKPDSIELDEAVMPADSHVSRTVVEENGEELHIYRRNVAYGGATDHGTVFVGFCATQHPLDIMLRRMAGADGERRDALTRYTTPLSGAYYLVPSVEALSTFVDFEEG